MILAASWTFCRINFLAFDKEDSANDDAFSNAMGSVSSSIVDLGTIIVKFSVDDDTMVSSRTGSVSSSILKEAKRSKFNFNCENNADKLWTEGGRWGRRAGEERRRRR
jgi:hypothetical protein